MNFAKFIGARTARAGFHRFHRRKIASRQDTLSIGGIGGKWLHYDIGATGAWTCSRHSIGAMAQHKDMFLTFHTGERGRRAGEPPTLLTEKYLLEGSDGP